jgi:hypothetical protein
VDLLAWLKLLGDLPPQLQRAEPKTLRYLEPVKTCP